MKNIVLNARAKNYLAGKEEYLFNYYWGEMGSARSMNKLSLHCKDIGLVNPVTGKPPGQMAVWKAVWRWAALKENRDKAYKVFNKAQADMGQYVTEAEFKELLLKNTVAANQYKPAYQARWMKRNGYS